MSAEMLVPVLLSALSVLFAGNLWWIIRLVHSLDGFKEAVRKTLGEHGEQLAVIDARHEAEDRMANGRRRGDRHD